MLRVRNILFVITGLTALLLPALGEAPPTGCYGTYSVNVCYSPWKVVAAEPGYNGVVMRKGPSFAADPIYNTSNQQVVIPVNHHFGRSSNRDGGATNNCPDPGPRLNVNGFLWSYFPEYAKQGWVPFNVGGVVYAAGDTTYVGTLCGPAAFDFDCRYAKTNCVKYHGCGGSQPPTSTFATGYRRVIVVGSTLGELSQEKYYLRYAADSTTFLWLVPGDTLKTYCTASVDGFSWNCVSVECAQFAPYGCRGWIRSDALGPPIDASEVQPCYPAIPIPAGSEVTPAAWLYGNAPTNGPFQLTVMGVTRYHYIVQRSTNLTDWDSLQTNTAPFSFTETSVSSFQSRFYRAVYSP